MVDRARSWVTDRLGAQSSNLPFTADGGLACAVRQSRKLLSAPFSALPIKKLAFSAGYLRVLECCRFHVLAR